MSPYLQHCARTSYKHRRDLDQQSILLRIQILRVVRGVSVASESFERRKPPSHPLAGRSTSLKVIYQTSLAKSALQQNTPGSKRRLTLLHGLGKIPPTYMYCTSLCIIPSYPMTPFLCCLAGSPPWSASCVACCAVITKQFV